MKIGELVRRFTPQIFELCEEDSWELAKLMDPYYCKKTFNLAYSFCIVADAIDVELDRRYWTQDYTVRGTRLRVCNDWYERQREPFLNYLLSKGIIDQANLPELTERPDGLQARATIRGPHRIGRRKDAFRDWLIAQGYPSGSISSRIANVRRVEEFYGDLDGHYDEDRLDGLLETLRYSTNDEREGRPNPTLIPINGNIRNGLATYAAGVTLYGRFVESGWHDGSANATPASPYREQPPVKPSEVAPSAPGSERAPTDGHGANVVANLAPQDVQSDRLPPGRGVRWALVRLLMAVFRLEK